MHNDYYLKTNLPSALQLQVATILHCDSKIRIPMPTSIPLAHNTTSHSSENSQDLMEERGTKVEPVNAIKT